MRLSVKNVSKHYASVQAVDDLSFEVQSGEIFAMLGPNGAGKSSTLRMLIGLTLCDSGEITFQPDVGAAQSRLNGADFGYLPEERGLFQEASLIETLVYIGQLKGMTKALAKEQAEHWLARFDLTERQDDQLKTLSKGNQQKVQLISCIIHQPVIAFLDEPFSGLDPVNQEKVIEFLLALKKQGTTIILSAHQMSLVEKLADRFLLMNHGKATLYGSLAHIREQTSLGPTISLQFQHEVDPSMFECRPEVRHARLSNPLTIELSLMKSTNVPQLLQQLLQLQGITGVQSGQPELHDIYLESVKDSPS